MKLVSIVLPTYNGQQFISESVESVLGQSYQNWELIIVNDCSNDNTERIIESYAKRDKRIKIIKNNENKKLPASLNIGFSQARGDYYTWTSDDNLYKKNAIEYMVKFLDSSADTDLISCDFDFINEDGSFQKEFSKAVKNRCPLQLVKQCNIGACFLYRKEIAKVVGDYDINMFCAEDYDYWCRLALVGTISYSSENLYKYRLQRKSLTSTKQSTIKEKTLAIQKKYKEELIKKYRAENISFYLKSFLKINLGKYLR